jgi:dTDP-4-amino-4,6-dideoxygalactose transaminase
MQFLLGRFERAANEFYSEYNANNKYFIDQPIKRMSKLTWNLLHGIDYGFVEKRRKENYMYLHEKLRSINQLQLKPAAFMYPLMIENGAAVRKRLQSEKIYIPTLWPTVFEVADENSLEYKMAENILPLPIDQRYGIDEMEYIVQEVLKCIS